MRLAVHTRITIMQQRSTGVSPPITRDSKGRPLSLACVELSFPNVCSHPGEAHSEPERGLWQARRLDMDLPWLQLESD